MVHNTELFLKINQCTFDFFTLLGFGSLLEANALFCFSRSHCIVLFFTGFVFSGTFQCLQLHHGDTKTGHALLLRGDKVFEKVYNELEYSVATTKLHFYE